MRLFFIILLLLSDILIAFPRYFKDMTEKEINEAVKQVSSEENILKRIEIYSELFIKTKYKNNPLGEGKIKPLYSFKFVDCVTYVETVLALANSNNLKDAINFLQEIRYENGDIDYKKRHHFMMTQWIPANIKSGIIKDITSIGKTLSLKKEIKKSDFNGKFKKFITLDENLPLGTYKIKYIPIDYFLKKYKKMKIPSGTIMVIIRENKKNIPIFATHLGFIIKDKKKGYIFRSAVTNSKYKEVRDYHLVSYLNFYKKYFEKLNWPLAGVSLYLPTEKHEN